MKTLKYLIFIFIIGYSKAQNLVPNPSFELYDTCPNNFNQIHFSIPWFSPYSIDNAEYVNQCSQNGAGVPLNFWTYQLPKTGNAYALIDCYETNPNNGLSYREYIQTQLTDTLISGKNYCVSFYVNLANDGTINNGNNLIAINKIGMYISKTAVSSTNWYNLPYTPQIISNPSVFLTDTLGWMEINGTYTATGGEKYITIGNFSTDANTDTLVIDSVNSMLIPKVLYNIDDVTVVDCQQIGVEEIEPNNINFKLYPNPNSGIFTLEYHLQENGLGTISIYDVVGKRIYICGINSGNTKKIIDVGNLNAGTYFYEIKVNDERVKMDKLIIVK